MTDPNRQWFESIGHLLDGMGIAMCLFDLQDRTVAWNNQFLQFFPEHAGHVHAGETYRDNLQRFYTGRLVAEEADAIERYITAGIARHHDQSRAYSFEHLGRHLRVVSLPLENLGRMRLWCPSFVLGSAQSAPMPAAAEGPQDLLERVPDGLMLCDSAGCIQWVNTPFLQMYGLPDAQAAVGRSLGDIFQGVWTRYGRGDDDRCTQHLALLPDAMRFMGAPFELPLPHGHTFRVLAQPGASGACLYAHTDVTELKVQQARLARAEAVARENADRLARESTALQAVLHHMDQGVALIDADGRIAYFNDRVLELLDLPRELLASKPLLADVVAYQRAHGEFAALDARYHEQLSRYDRVAFPVVLRKRPNGRIVEIRSSAVTGGGMLRTYADVTERHMYQERMEHLASHDGLTGLMNRRKFLECLASEMALAQRTQGRFAVLYMDLDGFKPINDTYGHAAGDAVLEHVAQVLRHIARASDYVARLGGDEFAVLQRGIETPGQASALAERVGAALAAPFALDAYGLLEIGASIGIAHYPEDGSTPESLLGYADQAMYLAKADEGHGGVRARERVPSWRPSKPE